MARRALWNQRSGSAKIEMLKQVAKSFGLNPERILTKEAQACPTEPTLRPVGRDEDYARTLTAALREAVKKDILRAV